jgi:hypothetical protein
MDLYHKFEKFMKEVMEIKESSNPIDSTTGMDEVTIVPKKMKRTYVRKNPEEVLKRRQANVLINNLSRAKKSEERYFQHRSQTENWRKDLILHFPHLVERANQYLLKDEEISRPVIIEEMNEDKTRKRKASNEEEDVTDRADVPIPVLDLNEKAHMSTDTVIVQNDDKLVTAQIFPEPVYDGEAHEIKPNHYKSAIQKLFKSLNS